MGEVVATDVDTTWLDRIRHPNLRVLEHNVVTDDLSELGGFDLVHVRLVLTWVGTENAVRVLRQLCRLLNPGGKILAEEALWIQSSDPSHSEAHHYDESARAELGKLAASGFDPCIAMRIPRIFVDEGLVEVAGELGGPLTRGNDTYRSMLARMLEYNRDAGIEPAGQASIDQRIAWERDETLWSAAMSVTGVWGTRPT